MQWNTGEIERVESVSSATPDPLTRVPVTVIATQLVYPCPHLFPKTLPRQTVPLNFVLPLSVAAPPD